MSFQYLDQIVQSNILGDFLSQLSLLNMSIIVWGASLVFLYIVLAIFKKLTAGSKSDLDDVTIGVSSRYLTVILLSIGFTSILYTLNIKELLLSFILMMNNFVITSSVLIIIWKLIYKEYLQYYLPKLADESESNLDDILVPILQTIFPIVFFVVAILFLLQSLNVDVSGWGVIVGGASFVLAFALQNTLADLFAGIALIADSPFGKGDVIKVGEQIAEVKKIGIRVTELYLFEDHSTMFIPNSSLSGESIINLTYPTPDVRARMTVGVGYDSNPRETRAYMQEIATANPYVIGNPKDKVESMKLRLEDVLQQEKGFLYENEKKELVWGIEKWSVEEHFLDKLDEFKKFLFKLLNDIDIAENDGLDNNEIQNVMYKLQEPGYKILNELLELTRDWLGWILKDPNLFTQDIPILRSEWERKISRLQKRYDFIIKYTQVATLAEKQRIDTRITEFVAWVDEKFKDPYEEWKDPDADFEDMGDSALIFMFEFFVDDIKSERYERMGRVISDLRRNLFEKLGKENIEIPFPQQDVWFRSSIPEKK